MQATASASSATVSWRTSVPGWGSISYGAGGLHLWTAADGAATTMRTAVLGDLAPSTA